MKWANPLLTVLRNPYKLPQEFILRTSNQCPDGINAALSRFSLLITLQNTLTLRHIPPWKY